MADRPKSNETLLLDRRRGLLFDGQGRCFDPAARLWQAPPADAAAGGGDALERLSVEAAAAWLQRDSAGPLRVPVGVIGPREASAAQDAAAEALGRGLARMGLVVLCGGREGVMAAVCRGVAAEGGLSLGLLPDETWETANPHVGVALATGLGVARNAVIARAAFCLVAIGGGHGTLSEMAFALQFGRPVFALADAPEVAGAIRLPSVETALSAVAERLLARA